jgi:uncharacterized membrane protein
MSNTKTFIAAVSAITIAAVSTPNAAHAQKMEKCYGVVKAGKNDCKAADGRHTCAGYAKEDANFNEWILLPYGACERIVNASTIAKVDMTEDDYEEEG